MPPASLQLMSSESRNLARALGWFSIALGAVELLAPQRLARMLGMHGHEAVLQLYGLRELASGAAILATGGSAASVWSRVGGDALDAGTLALQLHPDNPKRANVAVALAAVGGISLLDWACAQALSAEQTRRLDHGGSEGR